MIDWGLAEQIAAFVAGSPPRGDHVEPQLRRVSDESARLVGGYTGLEPAAPLPTAEALDRPQWINANVRSLRAVLDPVTDRMLERSAPLRSPLLRGAAGL